MVVLAYITSQDCFWGLKPFLWWLTWWLKKEQFFYGVLSFVRYIKVIIWAVSTHIN